MDWKPDSEFDDAAAHAQELGTIISVILDTTGMGQ